MPDDQIGIYIEGANHPKIPKCPKLQAKGRTVKPRSVCVDRPHLRYSYRRFPLLQNEDLAFAGRDGAGIAEGRYPGQPILAKIAGTVLAKEDLRDILG